MKRIDVWTKTCLKKKKLSFEAAENIISKAKKNGIELYKYSCPYCFGYHLTKTKQ